jgi:RNA polymerase sigma-70 factor, ECF subfamily
VSGQQKDNTAASGIERQVFESAPDAQNDDAAIVERLKAGDEKAFEEVVLKYYRNVLNIAYRYTNDMEEALDLTQEVFLKVLRKISTFESKCRFYTWVYSIATHACMDRWRKVKRYFDVFGTQGPPKEELEKRFSARLVGPEEAVIARETEGEIAEAMMKLEPGYRMAFILRDLAGFSYEEISSVTGLGLAAVKTRIHRARLAMREELKDKLG